MGTNVPNPGTPHNSKTGARKATSDRTARGGTDTLGVERIRGRQLQDIRRRWFAKHPLCVHCDARGRIRLATQLDHIAPLHKGGLDFDRDRGTNRQGLCDPCHEVKTAADLGHKPKRRIGLDGFPIDDDSTPNPAGRQADGPGGVSDS